MKSVAAGDVYFLDSPFYTDRNDEESIVQCKRLSYLLGTCSSRPAVVIREPLYFDRYNTVTVLPALSKGDPAIVFKLTDRYGNEGVTEYRFVPHNPHTIPVARLGRRIGSLEPEELKMLLEAFAWIHDPKKVDGAMRRGKNDAMPELYSEAFSRPRTPSWKHNRDARSDVVININCDGRLRSDTNPEISGLLVDSRRMTEQATQAIIADRPYEETESPLPDSVATDEPVSVPVEKEFPDSMFSKETLNRVASRFGISDAYYKGEIEKRNILAIMDREYPSMISGLDTSEVARVGDIYGRMTPVDAMLFWPRLPSDILAQYAAVSSKVVIALKKICNTLRDMSPDEYAKRMANYETAEGPSAVEPESEPETVVKVDYRKMVETIKPYLTTSRVKVMPDEAAKIFLNLSMAQVKRAWSGPNFKESYNSARNFYRAKFKSSADE